MKKTLQNFYLKAESEDEAQKSPGKPRYICGYCGGTGKRSGDLALPCLICRGTGRRPSKLKKKCAFCEGTGLKPGSSALPCPNCGGWGYTK